jgi:Protein of unknown function (DUF3048) N-terminal domain/Protein of unknown function (DUF3048) C-terminal domain
MNTKQKNNIMAVALGVGVLVAFGFWYYILFLAQGKASGGSTTPVEINPTNGWYFPYQSALDGTGVNFKEKVNPSVVAVMIDNHPDARPSAGLSKARIVYEVPVEAPYTRFMALYTVSDTVVKVGPVRSARPYFVHWAEEYGVPMYMHSGGSPEGLALLASTTLVYDTNEFWNGPYFWRGTEHEAPHNVYTQSDLWQKWYDKATVESDKNGVIQTWNFVTSKNSIELLGNASTTLKIPYAPDYQVSWEYDSSSSSYTRFENKKPRLDEDKAGISAATVIVQFAKIKVLDNYGRLAVEQFGSGDALVYTGGRVIKGTWSKVGNNRTRWYDAFGADIPLMNGTIWVEVVPLGLEIK